MKEKLAVWFEQFKYMLKLQGVDISDPISCARIKLVDTTVIINKDIETFLQESDYLGQDKGAEITDPAIEWFSENLKSLDQLSEAQINQLYEKSKSGRIVIYPPDYNTLEMKQIYTNSEGGVNISQSISQIPHYSHVLMDGNYPDTHRSKAYPGFQLPQFTEDSKQDKRIFARREVQGTIKYREVLQLGGFYTDSNNPEVLGRVFTSYEDANNGFIMLPEDIMPEDAKDKKVANDGVIALLAGDRNKHPEYYNNADLREARIQYLNNGSDSSAVADLMEKSLSDQGLNIKSLIDNGLFVDEEDNPIAAGDYPWEGVDRIAQKLLDDEKVFLVEKTEGAEAVKHEFSFNFDSGKAKIKGEKLSDDFIKEHQFLPPEDPAAKYIGRKEKVRDAYAKLAEYGLEFSELEIMEAVNNPPDPELLKMARQLQNRSKAPQIVSDLSVGMEFYKPLGRLPFYMIQTEDTKEAKEHNLEILNQFKTKEGYRQYIEDCLEKAEGFDLNQLRNLDFQGFAKLMADREFAEGIEALMVSADFIDAAENEGIELSREEKDILTVKTGVAANFFSFYQTAASRILEPEFENVLWNKGTLAKYAGNLDKIKELTEGIKLGDVQSFFHDGAVAIYNKSVLDDATYMLDCYRGLEANNLPVNNECFKAFSDYPGKTVRAIDKDGAAAFYKVNNEGELTRVWQNDVAAKNYRDVTELGSYSRDKKTVTGVFKELSDLLDELKETGPGLITNSTQFNNMYTALNGLVSFQKSLDDPTKDDINRFAEASKAVNKAVKKYLDYKSGDVAKRPGDRAYKRYALALNLKDLSACAEQIGRQKAPQFRDAQMDEPQAVIQNQVHQEQPQMENIK